MSILRHRNKCFLFLGILSLKFTYILFVYEYEVSVQVQNCDCNMKLSKKNVIVNDYRDTTCSETSWRRGKGQKVVSYSYYPSISRSMAKKRKYFEGILANAKSLHIYYPGWIMRVYYDLHDFHPQLKELCRIVCIYDHVDLCNIRHLPGKLADESLRMFGMLWRFLPVIDPHVDLLLSRDLDSRFSNRELTAVQEWMNSDKILHIMRDHPFHNVPILGGLWGANLTNKESRILWEISWKNILLDSGAWASRFSRGSDQVLLKKYVWDTWGWNYALQHDSYKCKRFANSKPWPVERLKGVNNFVGAISNLNKTLVRECPKECRKYIEWKYC